MTKEEKINQIAAEITPGEISKAEEVKKTDPEALKGPEKIKDLGVPGELPMLPNGKIDAAILSGGKVDSKGRYILEREVIEKYYRLLPDGCISEDREVWTSCGGLLHMVTNEARKKGGETLQATLRQRRTFKETIDIMLKSQANDRELAEVGLEKGATNLDVLIAAAMKQAGRGNVKAMDFLRDTAGEKPVEQLNADITGLSEEDKQMIENIKRRLEGD
ncbi:MAG: hypothetical protein IKV25_01245 [Clostridia bacterium]|nr:hypothetical protein [Bacteroidaceae bacterium]MBR4794318.1 hypothetical protein [Bacteroidaceae bacterium]MBR5245979.1 hypothetical protein [Clostridia bacterium]